MEKPKENELRREEKQTVPSVRLVVERGKTVKLEELPENSIALDGFVQGPEFDIENNRFSFDHHDKVNRQITKATCQQILDALLLGFEPGDKTVFVNDVDGDTVLSVWLLNNPSRASDPKIRALVESVGGVDSHGPAYPAADPELNEIFFRGIMQPEDLSRRNRQYSGIDLTELLNECMKNLDDYLEGRFQYKKQEDNRSFEVFKEGTRWVMVRSDDFIFDLVYRSGHNKAVAFKQQPDGSYSYTVAKKSDLVGNFPVGPASKEGTILYELNRIEPGWGGGSSIGGAPRNPDGSRSHLPPEEVFDIIEKIVSGQ